MLGFFFRSGLSSGFLTGLSEKVLRLGFRV